MKSILDVLEEQHEEIYKLLDSVKKIEDSDDHVQATMLYNAIEGVLDHLIAHFSEEENLFLKNSYPNLKRHKQFHDEFINELNELELSLIAGNKKCKIMLLSLMYSYLVDHLNTEDRDFINFLKDK